MFRRVEETGNAKSPKVETSNCRTGEAALMEKPRWENVLIEAALWMRALIQAAGPEELALKAAGRRTLQIDQKERTHKKLSDVGFTFEAPWIWFHVKMAFFEERFSTDRPESSH
jgi:hypothetical protein